MTNKRKRGSEIRGVASMVTDATIGITNLIEDTHKRIVHPPFLPSTPIQNLITKIAGITFQNIKWSTKFIGSGLDKVLTKLTPLLGESKPTHEIEAIRSVLNGILGDYLEEKENPLEILMTFRHQAISIVLDKKTLNETYPNINGKILLMIHGSCMNDIQWTQKGQNHGEALAQELDKSPIYLHYNSGLHISTNGQKLNELLEELILNWPVPIEEIVIIAHSMGGLVTRSAVNYGQKLNKSWIKHLKKIIFLGTPHHGASLERMGNYVDGILESISYSKPFARLGKIRSSGVTDLRYGNLVDEDWIDSDRFELRGDQRKYIPLPTDIACYSIAAVKGRAKDRKPTQNQGDGLVNIKSALGLHEDASKNLNFKEINTWVAYELNHVGLLNDTQVYVKIKEWLA